jgi:hypothetical protein
MKINRVLTHKNLRDVKLKAYESLKFQVDIDFRNYVVSLLDRVDELDSLLIKNKNDDEIFSAIKSMKLEKCLVKWD